MINMHPARHGGALALLFAVCAWPVIHGEVLPATIFGDGAVLQRDMPVPIWGTAAPGEKIEVVFRGQKVSAMTDGAGRWRVALEPLPASAEPSELIVRGDDSVRASNILVGDVWLCSGQSNMEMPVRDAGNAKEEMAAAIFPQIRQFYIPRTASETPQAEARGAWTVCSPGTVGDFSAAAYYFGRELHQRLNVPIGLINSSRGATQIESWMSEESLRADPAFARVFERWQKRLELIPARMRAYEEALLRWDDGARRAREQGLDYKQPKPKKPDATEIRWKPAGLYNAMIHPITPASIRGVIWYQGETNSVRHGEYAHLFKTMITQWRAAFRQPGLPFYYVQLANTVRKHDPTGEEFAFLREAQRAALQLPGTGMVVTADIGDGAIHPANKQDAGRRIAGIALAKTYGQKIEYSGPLFAGAMRRGHEFHIQFSHAQGLFFSGSLAVTGFELADKSMDFVAADARIDGERIIVSSPRIKEPHTVRYAWGNTPVAPLFNAARLPASPFLHMEDAGQ
jgi:sialate O-acetylesterase